MSDLNKLGGLISLGVLFLVGITVVFGSWYTVDQTQRAVLLRNGAFVSVEQPGLHFKMPWIDSVYKVDMQTHNYTWGTQNTGKFEAYSADQQPANLRVSVTLRVAPDKVQEFYERFGGDYNAAITRLVTPRVYERVKVVFGTFTAARSITKRGELNTQAVASLKESLAHEPVFLIEGVQVEDISFSGDYIKSVEQRMQAEVEVDKIKQNHEREKILAAIAVTQANGRADSVIAEAKANAEAIKLRGDAEATAIKARADALKANSDLITLTQAEKWDGKLPSTMIPGGAVPMIGLVK